MRAVLVCILAALAVSASVPKPFKGQQSYVYRFDTQVSSSLAGSTPNEIQQQAATRLRADVHISFTNDRHANVQLQHVRLGELNTELPKPQRVQPLEHFNRVDIPQELRQQLEQPFSVSIVDGVVERINFEESKSEKRLAVATETFSKNIKKAVLNMINLNLKRNDVNGKDLRSMSEEEKTANVFRIPEMTLEGDCYSSYVITQQRQGSQEQQASSQEQQFNVTKTIDFAKCSKTPVITFGYSPKASQEIKCQQCMRTQTSQQQQQNGQQQDQIRATHCQTECQPQKLNADNDVERSTFARFELYGKLDRYAIKRATILSSYIVKGQNPASEDAIMQVMSLSELTFKEMAQSKELVKSFKQSPVDEQLMYSPHFDVDERRFYEAGDESYQNNSPFQIVPQKEQKCAHAMRSILKQWAKKQTTGYEADTAMHFNRLVQLMRESSVQELKKIEDTIASGSQQQQQQGGDEQQSWCESGDGEKCNSHARELFIDALAVAATRNTLYVLAEKIVKSEISAAKATAALQLFSVNIHSPSEQQVEILKKIAHHDVAHRSAPLKQAIWLTLGSTIGQLCQQQPTQPTQAYFRVEEMCPRGKRDAYKKFLTQLLNDASSQYEQVLALKAIGNAAIDVMLPELRKLIVDKRQPTLVRAEAIDALRRLRTTQALAIRQTLMPIFLNQREKPEIRMASLSMILYTQPDKAVVDQLAFSILAEKSQNVKTFVFTALKALSQSPSFAEREIADHLKAQLKAIELSEEEMRSSRVMRAPIYVSERETAADQSVFLTLATVASPQSMIPAYIATSLRTALNGQATEENFKVSFTQQNLQQFYDRMSQMYSEYQDSDDEQEKSQMERRGAKDLKSLYNSLGLKSRRTGSYYVNSDEFDEQQQQDDEQDDQQQEQQQQGGSRRVRDSQKPFAMLVLRVSDVDMAILPISEQTLPQIVRKMLVEQQQKPTMAELEDLVRSLPSGHIQKHGALSLNEKKTKIPTTSGLPLALIRQVTAVGSIEAQVRMQMESSGSSSDSRGLNAHLKLHTSGVVTHMHESVVWTPVLSTGVKTLRTVEFNTPVELKIRADKQQVEIKVMPVRGEDKVRFFGVHTLPLTYTRHIEPQTQTKREARVKSVHNWALEHAQREWRTEQQSESPIIVDGHYHALTQPQQMLQALYTSENNVHIYLNPQQAPREIILRVSGSAFEKNAQHGKPEMDNFYEQSSSSSANRGFKSIFDEDDEQMQSERDEDRRTSLSRYNKQYNNGQQAYKHTIKLEAEAKYAQGKSARALVSLDGSCDSRMKHCKVFVEAERTPISWMREQEPWTLKAKVQTIMPELIRDEEEPSAKQSRALLATELSWGQESEKNELNLRIQAEPTKNTMWAGQSQSFDDQQQQQGQQQQGQQQQQDKWSRFCNKLDINAEYKLKPYAKHVAQSIYAALKSRFFWQLRTEQRRSGNENQLRASIVVDPMTRQYANISVQTPNERARIEGIQVPATLLALSTIQLNRRPVQYHSMSQMFSDYAGFEQATCKANARRVKTFDGVAFRAPTSSCWSVIAKDCSSEQSRFAVLMKKGDGEQQLRVKIITRQSTIELSRSSENERVQVKIDGQQEKDEQKLSRQGIELSYDRAYVQPIRGLRVNFDGEDVKVELSQQFKSKQCGLCGAYDDEQDNDFQSPEGKRSQSLKAFHKSYTLKNEECNESEHNKFYQENDEDSFDQTQEQQREQARRRYRTQGAGRSQRRSQWFDNEEESDEQQDREEQENEKRGDEWMNDDSQESTNTKDIKPKQQTAIYEYNNRICFSQDPVRQCPKGTSPDEEAKMNQKKTSFWCVGRSEGRKYQRMIHKGQKIESEGRSPSFVETIDEPTRCVAY